MCTKVTVHIRTTWRYIREDGTFKGNLAERNWNLLFAVMEDEVAGQGRYVEQITVNILWLIGRQYYLQARNTSKIVNICLILDKREQSMQT
jgi:hypothetical protein